MPDYEAKFQPGKPGSDFTRVLKENLREVCYGLGLRSSCLYTLRRGNSAGFRLKKSNLNFQ